MTGTNHPYHGRRINRETCPAGLFRLPFLFLCLLSILAGPLSAQVQGVLGKRFFDNWSIGIGGGPNIFFGDLKVGRFMPVTENMNEVKFGGTVTLTKQLSHVFAIRGQFLYSELSGTKRQTQYGKPYNQYFDGNVLEGNLNATLCLSNLLATHDKFHRKFFLYLTAGIGATGWNSNVKELGTGLPLRKSDSLGNWSAALMGMGGMGAYFSIHEKVNLGLELTDHLVGSDGVDATTGGFSFDAYLMLSFTVTYNFNRYNPRKPPAEPAPVVVPPPVIPPAPAIRPADSVPPPAETKKDTAVVQPTPVPVAPAVPSVNPIPVTGSQAKTATVYRVQVFAFVSDRYTADQIRNRYFPGETVFREASGGWFRFYVGAFDTPEAAKSKMLQIRAKGYKEAFVVGFRDGVRGPVR